MSTGDGRHKIGGDAECELHKEITAATRMVVESYINTRQRQQKEGEGYDQKCSVYQQEIADQLGISTRQPNAYQKDIPITVSKAVLLSKSCKDEQLVAIFAQQLGTVAVALPITDAAFDLRSGVEETSANLKKFGKAQQVAMKLVEEGNPTLEHCHDMTREGTESVIQMPRMIMKFEQIVHRKVTLHILCWTRSRHAAIPGIAPSEPNISRPGQWPEAGFAGDAPE